MNFEECMKFISSYSRLGAKVTDLSRAQELMERIGNPENKLKFVHIAGTNGKGSTLEYIANALELSGYRVGKLTSPYVTHYTDRIRINSDEIDETSLGEICEYVKKNVADRKYSQFEITMAIAFLWFEREKCDIVVLETGIGGLLDSTNVIPSPLLSVITSISLDHTAILGNTIEEITIQKAGIIKENSAVVLAGDNFDSVAQIVRKTAESKGAEFITYDKEQHMPIQVDGLNLGGTPFAYKGEQYKPAMSGVAQLKNAVTAIEACRYLRKKGFDISECNIRKSIETTQIKARIQYIDGNPPVIVDGGHNMGGVTVLSFQLRHLKYYGKKRYVIMGMVSSKDYEPCVRRIAQLSDKIFLTDGFADNAVPAEKLAEIAGEYTKAEASSLKESVAKATELARQNNGIVVICGSLYLASEYLNIRESLS